MMPFGVLIPLLAIGSITDLGERRIPNWLNYSAIVLALVGGLSVSLMQYFGHQPLPEVVTFPEALAGFSASFGAMFVIYLLLGTGAGDVKLAGAIGACMGVESGLTVLLWTHLLAGLVMAGCMIWKVGPLWLTRCILSWLLPGYVLMPTTDHTDTFRYPVPMAVFFTVGTMLTLLEVPLI